MDSEIFPLIQFPNPRQGDREPQYIWAQWNWAAEYIKGVMADVIPPGEAIETFIRDMTRLIASFRPTLSENQLCLRCKLGLKYSIAVSNNFNPYTDQGADIPYTDDIQNVYNTRLTELWVQLRNHYCHTTDYRKSQECVQGPDETVNHFLDWLKKVYRAQSGMTEPTPWVDDGPYVQQLKYVFITNMFPNYSRYIRKLLITRRTFALNDVVEYARNAERMRNEDENQDRETKKRLDKAKL